MSNIKRTTTDIKKKLSFQDYGKPIEQQEGALSNQNGTNTERLFAGNTDHQQNNNRVESHASIPPKHNNAAKSKATYYIGHEERAMITEIYIKKLKKFGKADRSALICQAIRLLYEREKEKTEL